MTGEAAYQGTSGPVDLAQGCRFVVNNVWTNQAGSLERITNATIASEDKKDTLESISLYLPEILQSSSPGFRRCDRT